MVCRKLSCYVTDEAVIKWELITVTTHRVVIPNEVPTLITFRQRDLPGFATVNSALREFEPKIVFSWHLSVLIRCVQLVEDRLPSTDEQNLLYEFEDKLDPLIKAGGNGLFFARVTHDALREIIWRVHDPEAANSVLRGILHDRDYPREFDFRIDEDRSWEKTRWYLDKVTVQ
jgi:hypothetical protein